LFYTQKQLFYTPANIAFERSLKGCFSTGQFPAEDYTKMKNGTPGTNQK